MIKKFNERKMHPSTYSFYCQIETPEDAKIGLLSNNTNTDNVIASKYNDIIVNNKIHHNESFINKRIYSNNHKYFRKN
jgi:DNA-directed RNA polymerase beta subunit